MPSLAAWTRRWAPPEGGDAGALQLWRIQYFAFAAFVMRLIFLSAIWFLQPSIRGRILTSALSITVLCSLVLILARLRQARLAGALLVLGLMYQALLLALKAGGIHSPGMVAFFYVPLLAGTIFNRRAAVLVVLLCIAIVAALVWAETHGLLAPLAPYSAQTLFVLLTSHALFMLLVVDTAVNDSKRNLERAVDELAQRKVSDEKLAMALEAGRIGVWEYSLQEGRFTGDQRSFAVFGLTRPDDSLMTLEDWVGRIDPADQERLVGVLEGLCQELGEAREDYAIVRPDGERRYLRVAAASKPGSDGRPERVVGLVLDETKRRRAEAEREKLVLDLGERVKELRLLQEVAKALRHMPLGRECLEKIVSLVPAAWMWPEHCQARIVFGDLDLRTPGWRETEWMMSSDFGSAGVKGSIQVAYMQACPPQDEGPFLKEERDLIGVLAQQLTSSLLRTKAEERRNELETELRQAQKMEALGTLAGGIAHDFNNLLSVILGNVQIVQAELKPEKEAHGLLESAAQAGRRAVSLVKSILRFSRKQQTQAVPVAMQPLLEEVAQFLATTKGPAIELKTRFAAGLAPAAGDEGQLHQVAMNLGVNAIHAMEASGGRLDLELDAVELDAPLGGPMLVGPGRYVRLRVKDSGTGMPPEVLEKIFDPFFSTKGAKGTGLGLSTVFGIVRDHAGHIAVDSEPGKGTEFRVLLPVHAEPGLAQAKDTPMASGSGEHVIYVDDEVGLVRLMSELIKRSGYRCTGFSDPQAALEAFQKEPDAYAALLTDTSMPAMTGIELIQAFKRVRSDIPVAMVSGLVNLDGMASAGLAGVPVLQKPPDNGALAALLRSLVRG